MFTRKKTITKEKLKLIKLQKYVIFEIYKLSTFLYRKHTPYWIAKTEINIDKQIS